MKREESRQEEVNELEEAVKEEETMPILDSPNDKCESLMKQMQQKINGEHTVAIQVLGNKEEETMPILDSPGDKRVSLMTQMQQKINGERTVAIQVLRNKEEEQINFFVGEWRAFKNEMKTILSDKEKKITLLDFDGIAKEWEYRPGNKDHWLNQKEKKEGERCSPLFYTILIGITFTLIPNCMIALDLKAAYEYLGGEWYIKRDHDPVQFNITCKPTENGQKQCFEQDIIWGVMTLCIVFMPGIFWSLGIFIQFAIYLRKKNPATYDQKRMLFFFFMPLAAVSMVTFPFQLIIVSVIACFNAQDNWMILTSKIGIAEGLFNAHFQYLLQLFIFFVRADRHPSFFQYAAAFGSLLFLVYSRIESLLVDRGGHNMSPGQKAWWVCRFGPMFLFNSAFKVGSISLITAMLRYNAIWIYGPIIILWLLVQFLFNEQYLPKKYYFLFIGAGMHAVSIAHIPEEVKIIHAKADARKNILLVTKLTDIQLKANMWFQNIVWFSINSVIIIVLTILAEIQPDTKFPTFWPFLNETVSFNENKVLKVLYIITPIILTAGLMSLMLLWKFDFERTDKDKISKNIVIGKIDKTDGGSQRSRGENEACGEYSGWTHDCGNCSGCQQPAPAWHRYVYSGNVTQAGVVGRLSQIVFPLMNIWQNIVDKNTA